MSKVLTRCCGPLMTETLRLLEERSRKLTYEKIAADLQGNGPVPINVFWLSCFASGITKRPDVDRVQTLYEYLSGKPLQL